MIRLALRRPASNSGASGSKLRPHSRGLLRLLLIAMIMSVLLGTLGLIYWKTRPLDESAVVEISSRLRAMKELEARWDTILLRSATDTGAGYAAALELVPTVGKTLSALRQAASTFPSARMHEKLPDMVGAFQEKNAVTVSFLAESSFVTVNLPLVQTAAADYVAALRAARQVDAPTQRALLNLDRLATQVAAELVAFAADGAPDRARTINEALAVIADARPDYTSVPLVEARTTLVRLGSEIVGRKQLAAEFFTVVSQSTAGRELDQLIDGFEGELRLAAAEQRGYRTLLIWYAVALLALLAFAGFRLAQSYRLLNSVNNDLKQVNESLEARVSSRTQELSSALSDLQQSETQLIQSEKMSSLGQMVAGVAHEINTPLAYVKNNLGMVDDRLGSLGELVDQFDRLLRMLQATDTPEDLLRDQFGLVNRSLEQLRNRDSLGELGLLVRDGLHGIDQIAEIVLNLKDFSRLDRLKVQTVDVNQGIESTLLLARHLLKQVEIRKVFGNLPPVLCAASQINQVFLNLITNAAQALEDSPPGKALITLTTRAVGHSVMIEIRDNGKGIPPQVLPRIFDPFFTTKDTGKGTGLGLSISFKIIEQHHGKILVHSRTGEGTTFTVLLPAQPQPQEADARAQSLATSSAATVKDSDPAPAVEVATLPSRAALS